MFLSAFIVSKYYGHNVWYGYKQVWSNTGYRNIISSITFYRVFEMGKEVLSVKVVLLSTSPSFIYFGNISSKIV